VVRAVLTGWFTGSGFDLAWISSVSSEHLCTGFPLTWKVRELIWSGKFKEFCWWSGNFGSLRTKTAIFVYVSGQSNVSALSLLFSLCFCAFPLSVVQNVVIIAQGVGVGEEEPTKM